MRAIGGSALTERELEIPKDTPAEEIGRETAEGIEIPIAYSHQSIADACGLGRHAIRWQFDPQINPPNLHVYASMFDAMSALASPM